MVRGGILRGLHAAMTPRAAHHRLILTIDLIEIAIKFPSHNGTQMRRQRDPAVVTRLTTCDIYGDFLQRFVKQAAMLNSGEV
jgi:hypothetical protein